MQVPSGVFEFAQPLKIVLASWKRQAGVKNISDVADLMVSYSAPMNMQSEFDKQLADSLIYYQCWTNNFNIIRQYTLLVFSDPSEQKNFYLTSFGEFVWTIMTNVSPTTESQLDLIQNNIAIEFGKLSRNSQCTFLLNYHFHSSNRILRNCHRSLDTEETMIQKLTLAATVSETIEDSRIHIALNRLHQMIKDVRNSGLITENINKHFKNIQCKSSCHFTMCTTTDAFPCLRGEHSIRSTSLNIKHPVKEAIGALENMKFPPDKLWFVPSFGNAVIRIHFSKSKVYLLDVTTEQMIMLTCFNEEDEVSSRRLIRATTCRTVVAKRHLWSLVHANVLVWVDELLDADSVLLGKNGMLKLNEKFVAEEEPVVVRVNLDGDCSQILRRWEKETDEVIIEIMKNCGSMEKSHLIRAVLADIKERKILYVEEEVTERLKGLIKMGVLVVEDFESGLLLYNTDSIHDLIVWATMELERVM